LASQIRRRGPLPFDEYLELALYDPDAGFFASGRGAGKAADFLTSPEVGPLFGAVVARALDGWWRDLGRPDPFVVVEAGAGAGTLARDVLAAGPDCSGALRYVLVERAPGLRSQQPGRLPLSLPMEVLGRLARGDADDDDDERGAAASGAPPAAGPLVTSLAGLPAGPLTGVVVANELVDNLPFLLLERGREAWLEVRVGLDGEVLVPAAPDLATDAGRLAPGAAPGARIPLQRAASAWLREALGLLFRGRVVVIDYATTTPDLAARPWETWLRTYRAQQRGGPPVVTPGQQDITCEVAIDQLARVRAPVSDRPQAEFLRAMGLDAIVEEARRAWQERAPVGDLEALRHRSRLHEARALTDPTGLGAFRVLEWEVGR
jgi:SAM-dependent MidA family methyltransferase